MTSNTPNRPVVAGLLTLTDEELVKVAKLQLPYVTAAYEALFARYYPIMMQVCFRYLHSQEEAEETVNDVMLALFHNLNRFEAKSKFKTWLFKIAHNQCLDKLKKKKLDIVDLEHLPELSTEQQEQQNLLQLLNRQLSKLSLDDRSILVFRITADLEFKEIAAITGLKLSAVKMRYKRILDKLSPSSI